jgi:DNA mismatch endonuclease (patch repair protein)
MLPMVDVVTAEVRSRMMSGIRGKNTRPEMIVRKGLFAKGFRYRIHTAKLPGKPDLVFSKYRAVIFVHGCFWHGHDCALFKWPSSNKEFWRAKIERNRLIDQRSELTLHHIGWRVFTVWECALMGPYRRPIDVVLETAARWLYSNSQRGEIGHS